MVLVFSLKYLSNHYSIFARAHPSTSVDRAACLRILDLILFRYIASKTGLLVYPMVSDPTCSVLLLATVVVFDCTFLVYWSLVDLLMINWVKPQQTTTTSEKLVYVSTISLSNCFYNWRKNRYFDRRYTTYIFKFVG